MRENLESVKEHYAQVANATRCPCCDNDFGETFNLYAEEALKDLPKATLRASRGCGDPVAMAALKPGELVLDLGSGGGIDALIAARMVGAEGHVWGLDMTLEMVELARANASKSKTGNVEFLHGTIDDIPLEDNSLDAVISNCVINFCDNKQEVLAEALRVLKPNGRLVVSDIVAFGTIPPQADGGLRSITGCSNGFTLARAYERMLKDCGYRDCRIEPKTIYTMDVLQEKAQRKGREAALTSLEGLDVGSLTGSVIVKAWK